MNADLVIVHLQSAVNSVKPPNGVTGAKLEYWKAGARAAINMLNTALRLEQDQKINLTAAVWHPAGQVPDTNLTVLVYAPDASDPVWPGFWDSETESWRWIDGDEIPYCVTHWASLPEPPKA